MLRRFAAMTLFVFLVAACGTTDEADPLSVTSLVPENGATNVSVDVVLEATFDQDVDEATIDGAFTLASADGDVAGTVAYDAASRTASFTPSAPLAYATSYTATVAGTVATTGGVTLEGEASWSFTTETANAIGGLEVTPAESTIVIGDTVQLTATATGVTGNPDDSVTWSSDDEEIATVDADGLVTAAGAGTATITAQSVFDETITGTATVTGAATLTGSNYIATVDAEQTFSVAPDITGGADPFTFEVVDREPPPGAIADYYNGLPPGVSLDATTGEITGASELANFYRAPIEVTDGAGQTIEIASEIDVNLVFSYASATYGYDPTVTATVADPQVVVPATAITLIGSAGPEIYSMTLTGSGVEAGDANAWSIDAATGAISRVAAITTNTTTWTFEVTVVDDGGSKSATFDITLVEANATGPQ